MRKDFLKVREWATWMSGRRGLEVKEYCGCKGPGAGLPLTCNATGGSPGCPGWWGQVAEETRGVRGPAQGRSRRLFLEFGLPVSERNPSGFCVEEG